jgi:hypothetical protein
MAGEFHNKRKMQFIMGQARLRQYSLIGPNYPFNRSQRNITERKRAKNLTESDVNWKILLRNNSDGAFEHGREVGRFVSSTYQEQC